MCLESIGSAMKEEDFWQGSKRVCCALWLLHQPGEDSGAGIQLPAQVHMNKDLRKIHNAAIVTASAKCSFCCLEKMA